MSRKALHKFLLLIIKNGNRFVSIIPITILYTNSKSANKLCPHLRVKLTQTTRFWSVYFLFSIASSLLGARFHWQKSTNLIFFLFHIVIFICLVGCLMCFIMFHKKTHELCQFFNQVIRTPNNIFSQNIKCQNFEQSNYNNKLILLATVSCYLCSIFLCGVAIPIVVYLFPELVSKLVFSPSLTEATRIIGAILQAVLFLPGCIAGATASCLAIVALNEIKRNLKILLHLALVYRSRDEINACHNVYKYYQRIQIFVGLGNACFQTYYWTALMFCGASGIITLIYPLLVYGNTLPIVFRFLYTSFALLSGSGTCFILSLCSEPIMLSTRFLVLTKQWKGNRETKLRFRGCLPVALKVGEFHTMDKGRVVAYVRFILQRSIFLALKSTKSKGF